MKKILLTLVLAACGVHAPREDLEDRGGTCVHLSNVGAYYCSLAGRAYLCDYHACAELLPGVRVPSEIP
jgi:hypothetical protein